MKTKHIFTLVIMLSGLLFSCSASDKIAGVYQGIGWYFTSGTVTANLVANGNDKVNIIIDGFTTNGVSASLANNVVTLSYSNSSAANHNDLVSIDGTVNGNNISLTYVFVYTSLPYTQSSTFTGTRQ